MTVKSTVARSHPIADWPAIDQRLWLIGQGGSYVATRNPAGLFLIAQNYGRWLSLQAIAGRLDETLHPADRVTPASVQSYVNGLQEAGLAQSTISDRLSQLATALRIMAPAHSFTWLHASWRQRNTGPAQLCEDSRNRLQGWPDTDRRLWQAAFEVGDILTGPHCAAKLRPATIHTATSCYQRWLAFLRTRDRLDLLASPGARVTRENIIAYVKYLRPTHCNAGLITHLSALRTALRILQPEADFCWLTAPGGRSLASLLPITKKPIQVVGSKILYEWGLAMMQDALVDPHPDRRRMGYRDGLLIALFAARAPRVRSMASLCVGRTVIPNGATYRLVFEHDDVKTRRLIEYDAPAGLSAAIDRYIAVERAELLGMQSHSALWLNKYGAPLSAANIGQMIHTRSKQRFGKGFGPHRFRHALGTTAPLLDPAHPGVAAAVLGISSHMVERHYNRASQADVAGQLHATLRTQRANFQSLAHREFQKAGGCE